ncbi:MAG: transcription/translation regulatory transformer protein RfaH [Proteobacteria bacterium]|nr:transcription/translation regulatory transformer protein RfaH [Pseudomonadota bacterium]
MIGPLLRWYLVHTKSASESVARENLERQRYDVYLPRIVESVRRGERRIDRIAPLFPRYLFLRLNEGQQALAPVASTIGVAAIVRFGSQYTIVPDRVVRELQERADPHSGLHRLNSESRLTPGATVRIRRGPFEGLEGVFERAAGADRVVVLLNLLGQASQVCVSRESILLSRVV